MHTIKNNDCFSGIRRLCKWCNWKKVCFQRLRGFAGTWWQLTHQPLWGQSSSNCAQSCGRRWSATQRGAMRCLCHRWCAHWAEPCQPSGTELSASQQVYQLPHNAQANIKAQCEARASFPNVIGAIDCTHSAIKAPSHDEFVYQQETFSFHQCTDRMWCPNALWGWPGSTHDSYIQ